MNNVIMILTDILSNMLYRWLICTGKGPMWHQGNAQLSRKIR